MLSTPPPAHVTVSLAAAPTEAPRPGIAATGAGTWSVPDQLAPGMYRTNGSTNPDRQCVWQRLAGDNLAIVDTGLGNPGEPQTVAIEPEDAMFQSTDCGTWIRVR